MKITIETHRTSSPDPASERKPSTDFQPVTQKSNWGYWDELDGKVLRDGETVEVQYPDGTIERGTVTTKDHVSTISDMGAPCAIHDTSAFIRFEHHGAEVKLGLRGMMARRVQ